MENINAFKAAIASICAALTALWGWFGWLVILWIFCMVADYATGSAAALKQGKWSSSAAREGIWHKMGAVVVVVIAAVLDAVIRAIIVHFPIITLPFDYSTVLPRQENNGYGNISTACPSASTTTPLAWNMTCD